MSESGYIETVDDLEKVIKALMTPTQVKAKEKANELIAVFAEITERKYVKSCCIIVCDENIKTLNSTKGMGKIHKVKFWKLVKENLENA